MQYESSDELYHYGRRGMKWGQHIFGRRNSPSSSSKSGSKKKKQSSSNKGRVKQAVNRGKDFVRRNKKPLLLAAVSSAAIASGAGFLIPLLNASKKKTMIGSIF